MSGGNGMSLECKLRQETHRPIVSLHSVGTHTAHTYIHRAQTVHHAVFTGVVCH